MENRGKLTIDPNTNVWPHELETAQALVAAGYSVHFVRGCNAPRMHKADVEINGQLWEIKSPETNRVERIQDILGKALHQAHCIIFDSRRMRKPSNDKILLTLKKAFPSFRSLRHLIYVDKSGNVIVLK